MDLVQGIVLGRLCGPEIGVHGGNAGVARHVVQPQLGNLHHRRLLTNIEKQPRGTHGRKGAGGDHVELPGRLDLAFLPDDGDHFLGVDHHGLAFADALVDLFDRLVHFEILPFIASGTAGLLRPFPLNCLFTPTTTAGHAGMRVFHASNQPLVIEIPAKENQVVGPLHRRPGENRLRVTQRKNLGKNPCFQQVWIRPENYTPQNPFFFRKNRAKKLGFRYIIRYRT